MRGLHAVNISIIATLLTVTACSAPEAPPKAVDPAGVGTTSRGATERVVIRCQLQCDNVVTEIHRLGGEVSVRYRNIDALAVTIPNDQLNALQTVTGVKGLAKDKKIRLPKPAQQAQLRGHYRSQMLPANHIASYSVQAKHPSDYAFNNVLNGVMPLHAQGHFGAGSIVAVIDSGVAGVDALAGSVLGGENLVVRDGEPSATSRHNDVHGTMVGSMIAAHLVLLVPGDDELVQSLQRHSPASLFPYDEQDWAIPLLGSAPEAALYALKVFPYDQDSADSSLVLAAMDRALTLKKNFLAGEAVQPVSGDGSEDHPYVYDALDINVVNLSLGSPSLFPGGDVEDQLISQMVALGMTVTVAAGNEGPGALTTGSPASAPAALSVGAASSAAHERIFHDLFDGPGMGLLNRPDDNLQVASFSSRGPTPYGGGGIDVMSSGVANLVQGADSAFYFVSGTSFAAPAVAGAAALLHSLTPGAKATQIRRALIDSADAGQIGAGAMVIDQGAGMINVTAAYGLLSDSTVDDTLPTALTAGPRPRPVAKMLQQAGYHLIELDDDHSYQQEFDLAPGQSAHLLLDSEDDIASLNLQISELEAELPAAQQNQLKGDRLRITVLDAPTTDNDILVDEVINQATSYRLSRPQSGVLRIALTGHRMNAGRVKTKIRLRAREERSVRPLLTRSIVNGQQDVYTMHIDRDANSIDMQLSWRYGWAYTPTLDLDLILIDPNGELVFDGATLRMPERLHIDKPLAGDWQVVVDGYQLFDFNDRYQLSAFDARGKPLRMH